MTAQPAVPVRRDRGTQLLLLVAVLVAVAGLAFAGGRLTAPAPASAANRTFGNGASGGFGAGAGGTGAGGTGAGAGIGRGFAAGIQGTVVSVNGSTMDVKLTSGTTVTVNLDPSTTYHTQVAADAGAVKTGGQVIVQIQLTAGATPAPSGAPRTLTATSVTVVTP